MFGEYIKNEDSFSNTSSAQKEIEIKFDAESRNVEIGHSVELVAFEPRERFSLKVAEDSYDDFRSWMKVEIRQDIFLADGSNKKVLTQVIDWSNLHQTFELESSTQIFITPQMSLSSKPRNGKITLKYS